MMTLNRRAKTKRRHEQAVVLDLVRWIEEHRGTPCRMTRGPDPPDAVIQNGNRSRWVEVVDVFWSPRWAQDQYSYATPGERHVPSESGPHIEPDAKFAENFVAVVSKKLNKQSYYPYAAAHGAGILIINIEYPLYDEATRRVIERIWCANRPAISSGLFCEAYLRIRSFRGYNIEPWVI